MDAVAVAVAVAMLAVAMLAVAEPGAQPGKRERAVERVRDRVLDLAVGRVDAKAAAAADTAVAAETAVGSQCRWVVPRPHPLVWPPCRPPSPSTTDQPFGPTARCHRQEEEKQKRGL